MLSEQTQTKNKTLFAAPIFYRNTHLTQMLVLMFDPSDQLSFSLGRGGGREGPLSPLLNNNCGRYVLRGGGKKVIVSRLRFRLVLIHSANTGEQPANQRYEVPEEEDARSIIALQ